MIRMITITVASVFVDDQDKAPTTTCPVTGATFSDTRGNLIGLHQVE
jgi:hypothetical protein